MTRFNPKKLLTKCKLNNCQKIATRTYTYTHTVSSSFIPKALKNERMALVEKKYVIPKDNKLVELLINISNIFQKILKSMTWFKITLTMEKSHPSIVKTN